MSLTLTLREQLGHSGMGHRFGQNLLLDQSADGQVRGRRYVLHLLLAPPLEDCLMSSVGVAPVKRLVPRPAADVVVELPPIDHRGDPLGHALGRLGGRGGCLRIDREQANPRFDLRGQD